MTYERRLSTMEQMERDLAKEESPLTLEDLKRGLESLRKFSPRPHEYIAYEPEAEDLR